MRANNGDVHLEWEETGTGSPVLLIHGLGYGRWGWGPLVERLATRFRVVTFDNRGIGGSSKPEGPYTASEMASDALAVLDAAGLERAHVVGTSLGGMIAQELTLAHPERVNRLVLLSTTPGAPDGYPMPSETVRLLDEAQDMDPTEALRRFVVNALGERPDPDLTETILELRRANPPDPVGWAGQAAAGTTYAGEGRARRIGVPTLVVTGTDDRVVDPRNSDLLGEMIPRAEVHRVEGGGHLVFWDHPDQTCDLLVDFLS